MGVGVMACVEESLLRGERALWRTADCWQAQCTRQKMSTVKCTLYKKSSLTGLLYYVGDLFKFVDRS